ncbi:MAG: hypothetical protein V4592_11955 [Bacteroidota bacterium]
MFKQVTKITGCFFIAISLSFSGHRNDAPDCTVTVNAASEQGIVSPNIMGFNIVYCYEGDAAWQAGKGKVPVMLKTVGARQLRYPGGTVVTKFHWEKPTGQGWSDSWAPDYNAAKNTDAATFMDLDEYLGVVKNQKTEPLVGINMGSGMKYNRVQDGVDEAIRLMKHCIASGVKVKYYYLDNEPYQKDANFTFTAEQYAESVNTYANAMRKIDPDIKIIVNTHPNSDMYTKALLTIAGKNIDLVDVHMYWKFKNATFENWEKEGLMKHRGIATYSQQRGIFEKIFADAGYPNIKMVVLEWNIGPPGDGHTPPTEEQAALMVSEQFTQYIQSGLFMSCFWPLSWPQKADWSSRALMKQKEDYKPNKMYDMFTQYTNVLGQQKVSSSGTMQNVINLAVKSTDGKTMWVYLINKEQSKEAMNITLALDSFKAKSFTATGFDSEDKGDNLAVHDVKITGQDATHYNLQMPKNSFTKITFKI